jgi:hypothetical protein
MSYNSKATSFLVLFLKHIMHGKARGLASANRNNVIYEACGSAFLDSIVRPGKASTRLAFASMGMLESHSQHRALGVFEIFLQF